MQILLFIILIFSVSFADVVELDSKITNVTVFNDRAEVKREAVKELKKGVWVLKFLNLPSVIDKNSIRVDGFGKATIKDVSIKKNFLTEINQQKLKILHSQKDEITNQLNEVKDEINRLIKEKNLIDNIMKRVTTVANEEKRDLSLELDMNSWIKAVEFYTTKLENLDTQNRKLQQKQKELIKQQNKIALEIQNYGKFQNRYNYEVAVSVDVKEISKIKLNLTYITFQAKWYPLYDIRVSSDKKEVTLGYNAMVTQNSGEDWSGVLLKLSTAKPSIGGSHPKLSPWYLTQNAPYKNRKTSINEKKVMSNMVQMYDKVDTGVVPEEPMEEDIIGRKESLVDSKISSAIFSLTQKSDIPSDNTPYKVTIMIKPFKVDFRYSTVPKLSKYAYLKAKIVNSSEFPLIAGKTNIYLDNNFIANSKIKTISSGEDFWIFLGADEEIKVEYKKISKLKEVQGIISKESVVTYEYKIEVTNNKKESLEIVIWDQLPISSNKDIKVELLEPKNLQNIKMNENKFVEWIKTIKPKEKIVIPFKYKITHPKESYVNLP